MSTASVQHSWNFNSFDSVSISSHGFQDTQDMETYSEYQKYSYQANFDNIVDAYALGIAIIQDIFRTVDRTAQAFTASWRYDSLRFGQSLEMYSDIVPSFSKQLNETITEISEMTYWGSDTNDDPAPDLQALSHAAAWIIGFYQEIDRAGYTWKKPNVTLTESGNVVFDWWHNSKALGVYVTRQDASYIKEWGADMVNEMSEGNAEPSNARKSLWSWLQY